MSARKTLGRLALTVAALTAALLLVRMVLNITSGRKLEAFLMEAKAAGKPVVRADLGPDCPGPDNAMPLVKAAAELYDVKSAAAANLSAVLAGSFEGRPVEESARAAVRAAIEANRRSLDLLLEAASRTCFRIPGDQNPPGFKIAAVIRLVRLLGFEALFRVEAGDREGGLREWILAYRLSRLLAQEPELIFSLVAVADGRSLLALLNRIVEQGALKEADLSALLAELNASSWRAAMVASMKGERVLWVAIAKGGLEGRHDVLPDGWWRRALVRAGRPWVRRELMRRYAEFDELERLLGQPFHRSFAELTAHDDREERLPWTARLIDGGGIQVASSALKTASLEALVDAARIGIAARILFLREKRLPAAVGDLVPGLLAGEPMDPFTGEPFVLRREGNRLLAYSLGSNRKDDGGWGTFLMTQLVQEKDDDWAWRDLIR